MAYTCLIGPELEDAVAYARALTGDTDPTNYQIPDASYAAITADVNRDLSRFLPLSDIVGDIYNRTSTLVTSAGVTRYICNAAGGFNEPVRSITDVLYRATGGLSGASEIGYLALLPFSPMNMFLYNPSVLDQPTGRFERDAYLNELDHYGIGKAGIIQDRATGKFAIDLFPTPGASGLPIYVRYDTNHIATALNDGFGSVKYPTIPEQNVRDFKELLLAKAQKTLALIASQTTSAAAGQIKVASSPEGLFRLADRTETDVYLRLGVGQGVGEVSS